jgi:hypothetical protein
MDGKDPGNWTGGKVGKGQLKGTKYDVSAAAFPKENIAGLTKDKAIAIYKRARSPAARLDRGCYGPLSDPVLSDAVR